MGDRLCLTRGSDFNCAMSLLAKSVTNIIQNADNTLQRLVSNRRVHPILKSSYVQQESPIQKKSLAQKESGEMLKSKTQKVIDPT